MHPSLIPVSVQSIVDVQLLAETMFKAAGTDPIDTPPEYSTTKEEALQRVKEDHQELIESGCLRIVNHGGGLFNLVLTLDVYGEKPIWHLSMSALQIFPGMPGEIPEQLAEFFVEGFFGDQAFEIPREGFWKTVRHYGMYKKCPVAT